MKNTNTGYGVPDGGDAGSRLGTSWVVVHQPRTIDAQPDV